MTSSKASICQGITRTADMKKDEQGYYQIILGKYSKDIKDNKRMYYLAPSVLDAIKKRASNGSLFSEFGFPKFEAAWSGEQCINRIMQIDLNSAACEIKDIDCIQEKNVQIVTAKIKPCGFYAKGLQFIIDQGTDSLMMSHRALSDKGMYGMELKSIITWDIVKIKKHQELLKE